MLAVEAATLGAAVLLGGRRRSGTASGLAILARLGEFPGSAKVDLLHLAQLFREGRNVLLDSVGTEGGECFVAPLRDSDVLDCVRAFHI